MVVIAKRFNVPRAVPDDPERIFTEFPDWLALVQSERMVLVIDGMNQLAAPTEGRSRVDGHGLLRWLPNYIQPNVSLILSAAPGSVFEELRAREWPTLEIDPLDPSARQLLLRRVLGDRADDLRPEIARQIASDSRCANPLFLRTSLNQFQSHRTAEERNFGIEHFLNAGGIEDLFVRVFDHLESVHGVEPTRKVFQLLWCLRRGLHTADIGAFAGLGNEDTQSLLASLDPYLIAEDGGLMLFHEQIKLAILNRYVGGKENQRKLRKQIAVYFGKLNLTARQVAEQPWQLLQAREFVALEECVLDIGMFFHLMDEAFVFDLLAYWRCFDSAGHRKREFLNKLLALTNESGCPFSLEDASYRLGKFLFECGEFSAAERSLRRALELRRAKYGEHHSSTLEPRNRLVELLSELGKYEEAESICRESLALIESDPALPSEYQNEALHSLGLLLYHQGDYAGAEPLLKRVSDAREASEASPAEMSEALKDFAAVERALGKITAAEELLRRGISVSENWLGCEHPLTATLLTDLASLLHSSGRSKDSIATYRRALAIREQVFGSNNRETAQSYHGLSIVLESQGEDAQAESFLRRALEIHRSLYGTRHSTVGIGLHNLARILRKQKKFDDAQAIFQQSLDILETSLGAGHPTTAVCRSSIGELQLLFGNNQQAESMLRCALADTVRALGEKHFNSGVTKSRLAEAILKTGDYENAVKLASEALDVLSALPGTPNVFTANCHLTIAFSMQRSGNSGMARQKCAEALDIYRSLSDESYVRTKIGERLLAEIDSVRDEFARG